MWSLIELISGFRHLGVLDLRATDCSEIINPNIDPRIGTILFQAPRLQTKIQDTTTTYCRVASGKVHQHPSTPKPKPNTLNPTV